MTPDAEQYFVQIEQRYVVVDAVTYDLSLTFELLLTSPTRRGEDGVLRDQEGNIIRRTAEAFTPRENLTVGCEILANGTYSGLVDVGAIQQLDRATLRVLDFVGLRDARRLTDEEHDEWMEAELDLEEAIRQMTEVLIPACI